MTLSLRWLALEVKNLDQSKGVYQRHLDLPLAQNTDTEAVFEAGETEIILRRPTGSPRGGLHTHYAFSIPATAYDGWWERLSPHFDLTEFEFGASKSLYFYDTDGNCVEIGQSTDETEAGDGSITGVFEVVLEVESLDHAESFYTDLGCTVIDRGTKRRRIRLTTGSFDLELWEPQLGIADARGGVHVDIGLDTGERTPEAVLDSIEQSVSMERLDPGIRVTDPDGHYVTLLS